MLILIAIIWVSYHLIQEVMEDSWLRNDAIKKEYDVYGSSRGLRYTKSNEKVYK